jgi:hypothetical protein
MTASTGPDPDRGRPVRLGLCGLHDRETWVSEPTPNRKAMMRKASFDRDPLGFTAAGYAR